MNASTSQRTRLRVALFSGNYNYVRDGANQALNLWVEYLERTGAAVRVYSPTSETPAFAHSGTLVSVPSVPIPRRSEYRVALGLPEATKQDILDFQPNIIHLSAPDLLGYRALRFAQKWRIPVVASVHTRFETYFRYYGLTWLEKYVTKYLRHFYSQCAEIYVPTPDMGDILRAQDMSRRIKVWSRGIDGQKFNPLKRSEALRATMGFKPEDAVILFVGRLVKEKGLQVFADTVKRLNDSGISNRVLVVGDGPERQWFSDRLPGATFTGFLQGEDLARAYAAADIFFNPSITETFGNVTLEAMASGLPSVCAAATGSRSLVTHGVTGYLAPKVDSSEFAQGLTDLILHRDVRRNMGAAARTTSGAYVWDQVMANLHNHFQDVLRETSVEELSRDEGFTGILGTFANPQLR